MTDELIEAAAKAIAAAEWGDNNNLPFDDFTEHARAAIRVIAPAVLEQAVEHLQECYANAMENGYSDHAQGVADAADQLSDLKERYSHDQ